jgi:methyl coenzyme M reductase subunit C
LLISLKVREVKKINKNKLIYVSLKIIKNKINIKESKTKNKQINLPNSIKGLSTWLIYNSININKLATNK